MGTTSNREYRYPASTDNTEIWTHIQNLADDVDADVTATWGASWTDYSSSLSITGSTTSPTKGNSTYSARYIHLTESTVRYVVSVTIGSSFSVGSGVYFFSMPVTPADSEGYGALGSCFLFPGSGSKEYVGTARISTSKVVLYAPAQDGTTTASHVINAAQVSSTFGWTTDGKIKFSIDYEV